MSRQCRPSGARSGIPKGDALGIFLLLVGIPEGGALGSFRFALFVPTSIFSTRFGMGNTTVLVEPSHNLPQEKSPEKRPKRHSLLRGRRLTVPQCVCHVFLVFLSRESFSTPRTKEERLWLCSIH